MLIRNHYKITEQSYICPVCKSNTQDVEYVYTLNNNKTEIFRCQHCGFLFSRPVFIEKLQDRKMTSVDDANFFNNTLLQNLYINLIIKKEISKVRRILGSGRHSLIDIGCATGWITNLWKEKGFEVMGLEPSVERGEIAKDKYGINISNSFIEDFETDKKFDVVLLRHILEHIENPYNTLEKISRLMSADGVLIVVVPNINCIGRYIFDTRWSWILPYHCNFFSPDTVKTLLMRSGFEVMVSYQTISPLWYLESFLRLFKQGSNLKNKFYKRLSSLSLVPFVPIVTAGYLLGRSDNITIIARINGFKGRVSDPF
ncbi:MAG: class I SAM-dependent methyltransferase [Nitrospirae bacterium]|nr:class I SAM-dependent methyltransferase [Nitrospirota bacterium]